MGADIAAGINCAFTGDTARPDPDKPNQQFAGCYFGPVAEPPGVGDVTIVFEAPPGDTTRHLTLTGCLLGTATFSGLIDADNTQVATLTVTSVLAPQMTTLIATRDTRGPINATVIGLATPPGTTPVFRAPLLTRCHVPAAKCAGLGVMQ